MTVNPEQIAARQECANLIAAFAYHVDHREFDRAVALFASDGAFIRPDLTARGHAEIAAIWEGRPTSLVTRHFLSAPFFTLVEADSVTAVTAFTLYTVEWNGEGLPSFEKPAAIAEFYDRFVLEDGGWRIAERQGRPVLMAV